MVPSDLYEPIEIDGEVMACDKLDQNEVLNELSSIEMGGWISEFVIQKYDHFNFQPFNSDIIYLLN